jgi:hypothetical protein
VAAVVLASALTLAPWAAQASVTAGPALSTKPVSGIQSVVGCLSSTLCGGGGDTEKGVGDVIPVRHGVPGKVQTVRQASDMYSISCPNSSGCIALARPASDTNAVLVKIGSSGQVLIAKSFTVPAGVSLSRIACTTLTSCVVTGNNVFTSPITMDVGSWNGKKITLHKVSPPHGASDPSLYGLSCSGGKCYAVGFADKGLTGLGLILPVSGGKPGRLSTVSADTLTALSCVSKTRCYAGGYDRAGGLVWVMNGGKLGPPRTLPPDVSSLACSGSACTAAGTTGLNGTITQIAGGKPGSTTTVATSGGFADVARKQSFFIAVGSKLHGQSEVTSG